MNSRALFFLSLLFPFCTNAFAQALKPSPQDALRFHHYGLQDGLSSSLTWSIIQDNFGLMWFATQDGLDRFDGSSFKVLRYKSDDSTSIPDNWVRSVAIDHDGMIWLATEAGGIGRLDPRTLSCRRYGMNDGLHSMENYAVHTGRSGRIWVGPKEKGLNVYDASHDRFNSVESKELNSLQIQTLLEDSHGSLWIGTFGGGLFRMSAISTTPTVEKVEIGASYIFGLFEDNTGSIWVACYSEGVIELQDGRVANKYDAADGPNGLCDNRVTSICAIDNDILCITTNGGGICLLQKSTGRFYGHSFSPENSETIRTQNIVTSYKDRGGNLWLGTWGHGISVSTPWMARFSSFSSERGMLRLGNNDIWSFQEDKTDNTLFIGTKEGLDIINLLSGNVKTISPGAGTWSGGGLVTSIFPLGDHYLLGIFDAGVVKYHPGLGRFEQLPVVPGDDERLNDAQVTQIVGTSGGLIWIASFNDGVAILDAKTNSFKHFRHDPTNTSSLSNNRVYRVYQRKDGSIWLGTHGGLDKWGGSSTFSHFIHDPRDTTSLSHNSISDLLEDHDGNLWVGTFGGGLNRFNDRTGTFLRCSVRNGLPNDNVSSILEDGDGRLWLGTNRGLCRLNPQTGAIQVFGKVDGLPSEEFNSYAAFKNDRGEMYFGTPFGFTLFHPDSISVTSQEMPVLITSISKNNKEFDTTIEPFLLDRIDLAHDENFISFTYTVLDYGSSPRTQYAYFLDGLDPDWVYTGRRRLASYTAVPPGEYTFRVKACNHDGIWNEQGASLKIIIHPPFWRTMWFYTLSSVTFVGLVFAGVRLRLRSVQRVNRRLEAEVKVRTAELQEAHHSLEQRVEERTAQLRVLSEHLETVREEEKARIAREVHDELGQYLTVLKMDVVNLKKANDLQSLDAQSSSVIETIDETIRTVQRIASELRPTILDDLGLAAAIEWQAGEFAKRSGIRCEVNVSSMPAGLPPKLATTLFRVFQELLTNILRHSKASAMRVSLESRGEEIVLEVTDNGIGINPEKVKDIKSLGIIGINERIRSWDGTAGFYGTKDEGTTAIVRIPSGFAQGGPQS